MYVNLYLSCQQSYVGLKPQDLQEAKDALVVETADMLRVPLFTAEALLRNYGGYFFSTCVCHFGGFQVNTHHK